MFSPTYDGVGGRGTWHLRFMVPVANNYSHVFVMCGNNDLKGSNREQIFHNYQQFVDALNENIVVRIVGMFPRLDYNAQKVTEFNHALAARFGNIYKSPKAVQWRDFNPIDPAYLLPRSIEHLARLCLSLCAEYFGNL